MITLIFEDGEETVIRNILSIIGIKARVYEAGFQDKCTLAFHGLVIDEQQPLPAGTVSQGRYGALCFGVHNP